ncbi:MAG: hypothetical protein GY723_13110, partial [bacterium]|nr:hypothetical protein [bacterium]
GRLFGLIPLFDFNREQNVPTLYSSFALIVVGLLLSCIAAIHRRQGSGYRYWVGLAVVFLFLAIDETAAIHENLGPLLRESLDASGLLYYAWVIPYGTALILMAALYLRFLMRLPRQTMILFVFSGTIFIAGAIGVESIGGWYEELYGWQNTTYRLLYTVEEVLEMLGIATFMYALLRYIIAEFGTLQLSIEGASGKFDLHFRRSADEQQDVQ